MRGAAARVVNSLVFSPEEAKYLKAIFRWTETSSPSDDPDEWRRRQEEEDEKKRQQLLQQKPAGELRILVIGAKGTGKSALLTWFAHGTFGNDTAPSDPLYERGCRRPILLDEPDAIIPSPPGTASTTGTATTTTTTTTTTPASTATRTTAQTSRETSFTSHHFSKPAIATSTARETSNDNLQTYIIDALEMPSKNLHSNPLLAQALSITEGAALLFSVRDESSLRLAQGLAEFMREHFSPPEPATTTTPNLPASISSPEVSTHSFSKPWKRQKRPTTSSSFSNPPPPPPQLVKHHPDRGRPYPILLVGTKTDSYPDSDPATDPYSLLRSPSTTTRKISPSKGFQTARGMGLPPNHPAPTQYLETSALTGEGVEEVFRMLGREVLRARRIVLEQREKKMGRGVSAFLGGGERGGDGARNEREGRRRWWLGGWLKKRRKRRSVVEGS
ncbi:hypothetical protein VTJ04DRAFT_10005 [Mycothermus thermophilus]|uniref:uncharacterized protein n=1 Tax=Humicola insolens TaxID=85995 RepID=UPI0037445490